MTATPSGDRAIVERAGELDAIAAFVDAVQAGQGGVVVIEGVAGIGKTRLLQAGADRAARSGLATILGRGSQLEADFPFGVARQLFEPIVRSVGRARRATLREGSAEWASGLLLGPSPAGATASPDERAVMHGLYWLLAQLCDGEPHLVAVDDAHWADEASQRFLAFAAARIAGLPLGLIIGVRTGEGPVPGPLLAVERQPETVTLRPQALSASGVAGLLHRSLDATADAGFVEACMTATGGIPFYVRELLVELARDGVQPTAANVRLIAQVRPESVARAVVTRLAHLPPAAVAVAHALSVLEDASSESLLARLIGTDQDTVSQAVAAMRDAGVVAADRLTFTHPIVGTSVYQDVRASDRAAMHVRAAGLLRDAADDVERIAAHLLRSPPGAGDWAVDVLRQAATRALERGGTIEAVALLRRAAAEPADAELRAHLLLELGTAEWHAGMPESIEHLRAAVDRGHHTPWWGEAVLALGRALTTHGRLGDAAQLFDDASGRLADASPELALRVRVEFASSARPTYDWHARATEDVADLETRLADLDTPAARLVFAEQAMNGAMANEPAPLVIERARRAWGAGDLPAVESPGGLHYWPLVHGLICAGDVDTAERTIQTLLAESRRQGSASGYAMARLLRTILDLRRGTLLEAEADALEALALAHDHLVSLPLAVGVATEALVERGDTDQAQQIIDANPIPSALVGPGFHDYYLAGRGLLHMARQRWNQARDDLLQAGASMLRWNAPGPSVLAWRSRAALALAAIGDAEEAARLVAEEVELAEDFGSAHTLGVALRAAGLVAARAGDLHSARAQLERAIAVLDGTPFPLEAARAHTDLGALLRRQSHTAAARDHLRHGLDLALRCEAVPLAERARHELIASGARPRRPVITGLGALTATERRICFLAAQGLTNRHIAQELFVTIKTVEAHLTTSYRKLGITSRNQLPAHLDQPS